MASIAKGSSIAVLVVAAIVGLILLRGVVLVSLWGWFIVPLGMPDIGMAHAIGISLVASVFLIGVAYDKPDEDSEGWSKVVFVFIKGASANLFAWGVGAIVHGFM